MSDENQDHLIDRDFFVVLSFVLGFALAIVGTLYFQRETPSAVEIVEARCVGGLLFTLQADRTLAMPRRSEGGGIPCTFDVVRP